MELTKRFDDAFLYASHLHSGQKRKASLVPYISHLLAVTALVLQYGGDEDQAIAAMLHDAVEDQGGVEILAEIRSRFGERVARIVDGCTDSYTTPKRPWLERKKFYIERLKDEPSDVRLVSLADKVDNLRSIAADLEENGEETWTKFRGGKDGSIWYYRSLVDIFSEGEPGGLARVFSRLVDEIEKKAGTS